MRLAGVGQLCERVAGYTFFWSRREIEERREAEVGSVIKTTLVGKLAGPPKAINDPLKMVNVPPLLVRNTQR